MTSPLSPDRRRHAPLTALALLCTAALGGCGAAADLDAGTGTTGTATPSRATSTASASATAAGAADLVVTVTDGQGGAGTQVTLTCDPVGGTHPAAAAACAALAEHGAQALAPTPTDTACTEIYGGAQTATVTGTWRGEEVDASFSRVNGCEIDRWQNLSALFDTVGGVSLSGTSSGVAPR